MGWDTTKIHQGLDAVILGMHARADNPELIRAKELGLAVYSFPEYIYEQCKTKTRVVIGGSHGKTTITAMIMHVLGHCGKDFDYMVGSQLEGFETMVKLTADAPLVILEGDEYLSSPIDRRPKFHLYHPQIALLSGIAWDHINVFPTYENYVEQFRIFVNQIPADGSLVYCADDADLVKLCEEKEIKCAKISYTVPNHTIENGTSYLLHADGSKTALAIFGNHNLANLNGARLVCNQIGIDDKAFYEAISSFTGAARRLELVAKNDETAFYKDFAHSPSKLKATTHAMKEQYPNRKLIACMELHTFSSLNEQFLNEYKGAMEAADEAIVYFNPHTIAHKKLNPITEEQVKQAFGGNNISVYTDSKALLSYLQSQSYAHTNLLMMSSGTFDGIDFKQLAAEIMPVA
jgi:UDP-N-acetylmuramate: L-alanyl-gamma-D-glutamyl-meso-diaminopimelate ligase